VRTGALALGTGENAAARVPIFSVGTAWAQGVNCRRRYRMPVLVAWSGYRARHLRVASANMPMGIVPMKL
jgi:hypothetical protein